MRGPEMGGKGGAMTSLNRTLADQKSLCLMGSPHIEAQTVGNALNFSPLFTTSFLGMWENQCTEESYFDNVTQ